MGKRKKLRFAITAAGFAFLLTLFSGAGAQEKTPEASNTDMPTLFHPQEEKSLKNFPCSKCHQYRPVDRKKRKLELAHTSVVLKHAEQQRWCLDCHEGDKLKLPSGELIAYDKPYLLCGHCHGTIFRDWKAGIHGKVTGMWNGEKVFRVCVSCHDPHQPKFKQLKPEKQPMSPAEIKLNSR